MTPLRHRTWLPRPARRPATLAVEVLEERLTLSSDPISPDAAYQAWRQTTFSIDDAVTAPTPTVEASSATPGNASFGAAISLNQALATYPYRGDGYSVAVIDTGIDYNNPDLGGGWGKRVIAGYNFVNNTGNPMDDNGHGTNVAGIIGSSNTTYSGVVPDVNFIALKVLDQNGSGTYGQVDDALKWVIAHQAQYHIVAVNLSLGSGDYTSNPYTYLESDFTSLLQDGVFIAAAAGNDYYGNPQGLAYPAVSPNVVSVGAVWDGNYGPASWASGARDNSSATDQIVSFSQRSSALSILAPGAMITSDYLNDTLKSMAGTSMATPVVAGAAVLLHQALDAAGKGAQANQANILQLLQTTGASITDTAHGQDNVTHTGLTFKRLNVFAALQSASTYSNVLALSPIPNQTMPAGITRVVQLNTYVPGSAPLAYTAQLDQSTAQAYHLRQQLGLTSNGSYYQNAWGQNEKWLQGSGGTWYCLLPSGDLRHWVGSMSLTLQPDNLVATLSPTYYNDPTLLLGAGPSDTLPVSVSIGGAQVFVTVGAGYTGSFQVDVTALAAGQTSTQTFTVTVVAPTPPTLGAIAPVTVQAGQSTAVTLPGSDPDGDPLTYSAQILGSYPSAPAVLSISGNTLTIQTAGTFAGTFTVQVTVSDGSSTAVTTFAVTVNPGITAVARFNGDFNGDGRVDSVEFRSDGSWWVTPSGGSATAWTQWLPAANWKTVMVGDFNGDGKTDIGGFNNDGSWWVGLSTGSSFVTSLWSQWLPAASWNKVMTGDFNGDGKTDVVGFNNDGTWWVGQSTGSSFHTTQWAQWSAPAYWKAVSVGDFNGDGKTDVVGFNNDGTWWVGLSSGRGFATSSWAQWVPGASWKAIGVGDVNGDGKTDVIGLSTDGSWWVGYATSSGFSTRPWTPPASQSASLDAVSADDAVSATGPVSSSDLATALGVLEPLSSRARRRH